VVIANQTQNIFQWNLFPVFLSDTQQRKEAKKE
jgi:hypothetical protein